MDERSSQPSASESAASQQSLAVLAQQYNAAIGMQSQTNSRRTANARFFISLISGLIALLALALRPGFETHIQLWIINIVAGVSIFLCLVWFLTVRSLTQQLAVQRALLQDMEEQLPFAFVARQEELLRQASGWMRTGLIEGYVPLLMMIPAVLILWVANTI